MVELFSVSVPRRVVHRICLRRGIGHVGNMVWVIFLVA